jgi:hypothetical protein
MATSEGNAPEASAGGPPQGSSQPTDHPSPPEAGPHVQPDVGPPPPEPHHPEVQHEHSDVNVRAILWSGAFIVVLAAVTHVVVWLMFLGYQKREEVRDARITPMFKELNEEPLPERLLAVPPPRLEGFEPAATLLVVRKDNGEEVRLDLDPNAEIEFGEPPNVQKGKKGYDLSEGMYVSVVYRPEVGHNVVLAVQFPPGDVLSGAPSGQRRDVNWGVYGTIVRLDPKSINERRAWAEERLKHFGPVPDDKKAVRIPLGDAMRLILEYGPLKKEYLPAADGKDPAAGQRSRLMPTQTNSGRGRTGEAR